MSQQTDLQALRQQLDEADEALGFGYFPSDGTGRVSAIKELRALLAAAAPAARQEQSPAVQKAMARFWKKLAERRAAEALDLEPLKARIALRRCEHATQRFMAGIQQGRDEGACR